MEVANLVANLLCPEYPSKFVVHCDSIDRFEELVGLNVDGSVGTIVPLDPAKHNVFGLQFKGPPEFLSIQGPAAYSPASNEAEMDLHAEISSIGRHERITHTIFPQAWQIRRNLDW